MSTFIRHSSRRSFDLLSGFSFYLPGIGGTLMMLLMVVIGACLGQFVSLLLAMVSDFQTAT